MALAGGLVGAGSAGAAFSASTDDPAGDSSSGLPGHDLLGAGIAFDQKTGYMVGQIKLRGVPDLDHGALLTLYAGIRTPTGCDSYPIGGFGSRTDYEFDAFWVRQNGPSAYRMGEAEKETYARSTVQVFEARTRRLAGKRWTCLGASLTDLDDPSVVYDQIRTVRFKGLPAISMRMPKARRAIRPNRTRRLRVVIGNPGDAPLRNVRIRFRRDRGLKVAPRRRFIKVIRPGRRKVIPVRVRMSRRAGRSATLKAFARSGKLRARGRSNLRLKLPRRKPPPGNGGGGGVCVQYFPDLSGETGGSLGLVPC